jgi:hypothetical protein
MIPKCKRGLISYIQMVSKCYRITIDVPRIAPYSSTIDPNTTAMRANEPFYTRGVYNGKVLAKLVLFSEDTLALSSGTSSSGGAEASTASISEDTGRRWIREDADGLRAVGSGALIRD